MIVNSDVELEILREGGRRLNAVLQAVVKGVRPGISTLELDQIAERLILSCGGSPIFKGYRVRPQDRPFSSSLCASINNEVVHAIPRGDRILESGDILGLDIGMRWPAPLETGRPRRPPFRPWRNGSLTGQGLITDMAVTVGVGKISPAAEKLINVTHQALQAGISILKPGIHIGDLGAVIQRTIEAAGFGVIRELMGHGVGLKLHEVPNIPNYGTPGEGLRLNKGMVLAIEPMAAMGDHRVKLDSDRWTWRTKDGSLSAHFEHTVVIRKDKAEVLTGMT